MAKGSLKARVRQLFALLITFVEMLMDCTIFFSTMYVLWCSTYYLKKALIGQPSGFVIIFYPGKMLGPLPLSGNWPYASGECHGGTYFCGVNDVDLKIPEGTLHKFVPGCCRGSPGILFLYLLKYFMSICN